MVCALLLALTCAAAASAASYDDYSGVKMPQYSGGSEYDTGRELPSLQQSDDYHGHSPDAPASPDYKYEEEPRVKTEKPTKEPDESDTWRRPGRKQRELVRNEESDTNLRHKYGLDDDDDDEIPKFRNNRHYSKHRSRLKNEIEERIEEMPTLRRRNKHSRGRKDLSDIDRKDHFNVDKEYIPDDKNNEFDDDLKFINEENSKRLDRRRPRDKSKRPRGTFDDYDESPAERQIKGEPGTGLHDSREVLPRERPPELRKPPGPLPYQSAIEEEDDVSGGPLKVIPGRFKLKGYNDYDDYYDMKRVNNIKNRLPSLLRRTTVSAVPKRNSNLLEILMPNRRMMSTRQNMDIETEEKTSTVTQTLPSTTTTTTSTTTQSPKPELPQELSLAEKSRLSILKKAQRKEGQSFRSTKKPPVLLQVTSMMPTVVMVEAPSSTVAWMRAREEEDTPMRLEVVKRLMRQKIVKEAKSIHDLTNNWDEMVCDYIDMSLLENSAEPLTRKELYLSIYSLFYVLTIIT